MEWHLPFSKSHAIRYVALAALSRQNVTFRNMSGAGEDTLSMRRCLLQCGVTFTDLDERGRRLEPLKNGDLVPHPDTASWTVHGVGPDGLQPPGTVLHAGNSGTALRILLGLASRWSTPVMLDGDASLRQRRFDVMINAMTSGGVEVSHGTGPEHLPLLIRGPMSFEQPLHLDATVSSQPLTTWMIASAGVDATTKLMLSGQPVSQRHAALTSSLCRTLGASIEERSDSVVIHPWEPTFEATEIRMPTDASMMAFPLLAAVVCDAKVTVVNAPTHEDSLGHEILIDDAASLGLVQDGTSWSVSSGHREPSTLNLRDGNDLITPVAALLALGHGGTIVGAAHAAHKESNRLTKTLEVLGSFGMEALVTSEGLVIEGGQTLSKPTSVVRTWGDHRLQMTAIVLAMGVEGDVLIEGDTLHQVADTGAVQRWVEAGVDITPHLHQHW